MSGVWYHIALGLRQEDGKFEVSLGFRVRPCNHHHHHHLDVVAHTIDLSTQRVRNRWISDFWVRLVYIMSSRPGRAIQ